MHLVKKQPIETDQRALAKRQDLQEVFQAAANQASLGEVTVGQVMTPSPFTVCSSTTASELVQLFQEHRFRHFLVVDEGQLVGVLSDRDVIRLFGSEDFSERKALEDFTALDLMSPDVLSVTPDTPLREAVPLMVSAVINCLPIVEEGRPVGILTGTDMFLTLEQLLKSLE